MPSDKQRALYERLRTKFGQQPEWARLTEERDIEEMSPHLAFHFLQMLLWNLAGTEVPSTCPCVATSRGVPGRRRNEHPPMDAVGVRDRAVV